MKGYSFLAWAYNLVWIGLAAYLAFLFLRLRNVSRRLDRLENRSDRRGSGEARGDGGDQ